MMKGTMTTTPTPSKTSHIGVRDCSIDDIWKKDLELGKQQQQQKIQKQQEGEGGASPSPGTIKATPPTSSVDDKKDESKSTPKTNATTPSGEEPLVINLDDSPCVTSTSAAIPPPPPPPPQAAAAAAAATATTKDDVCGGDEEEVMDDDVVIEREDSAWDVLRDKFENAATQGRYLDLTGDDDTKTHGKKLTASDATKAFHMKKMPKNPSLMVGSAASGRGTAASDSNNNNNSNDNIGCPILAQLSSLIRETIAELGSIREMLSGGNTGRTKPPTPAFLKRKVNKIQQGTRRIQTFVNKNADVVLESRTSIAKIEKMNLLVFKANLLINDINQKMQNCVYTSVVNNNKRNKKRKRSNNNRTTAQPPLSANNNTNLRRSTRIKSP